MTLNEHLLMCLAEEGSEVTQAVSKSLRFGLEDRNVLDPLGPNNRERLVLELNDLLGVAALLVEVGVLPADWACPEKQLCKAEKSLKFLAYAQKQCQGVLQR